MKPVLTTVELFILMKPCFPAEIRFPHNLEREVLVQKEARNLRLVKTKAGLTDCA